MESERQRHWEQVYATKASDAVSWFQAEPAPSLAMIEAAGVPPDAPLIDVGGGCSRLADRLIERGFTDVTVLDVSQNALAATRARLGGRQQPTFVLADITEWQPPRHAYRLWHDRAVFHFLTAAADRSAYLTAMGTALAPGGTVILATFALAGPERCSGLPVRRYSGETLRAELGPSYRLLQAEDEMHRTPAGGHQAFTWCRFRKVGP
jgi:hypothetical protein